MRTLFTLLLLSITSASLSQIKLISWNVENFGKSKSNTEIAYIATLLNKYDLVALQEVVAGDGGAMVGNCSCLL